MFMNIFFFLQKISEFPKFQVVDKTAYVLLILELNFQSASFSLFV